MIEILNKWEEMDIIEDVGDEPTDWCSNVVLTPKKGGENIKASLYMTEANKYIKITRHDPRVKGTGDETQRCQVFLPRGHE